MDYFIPNLFIPGVAKCGTTTLHDLLSTHESIGMSSLKEPHFWTSADFNNYTKDDILKYKNLFTTERKEYFGESSTGSLFYPNLFISRLKEANTEKTNIKFIIILRNPIDRAYSHYWWCKGSGRERLKFKTAFFKDQNSKIEYYNEWPKHYYQFGLFSKWISPLINEFGQENIKFITLEALNQNTTKVMNDCFSFLGLKEMEHITNINKNKTIILKYSRFYNLSRKISKGEYKFTKIAKYFLSTKTIDKIRILLNEKLFNTLSTNNKYPKLSLADRIWTKNFYEDDVKKLKHITGLSFNEWADFNQE
ncbi:sulfotransferase domain-containing protein [Aestuariibaculum suncheonense]|uniref:Sulfotransferase domain-containing protein n=1 Tax=Aestuariibaculum suncheonense TaxID=1028745 RepID=A0A8J6Q3K7_9FLAO|nr:sulfotransferase domain-containing protein [Aestuariibaculum suncheonense]MBD0834503.1 sulfotransferase domain-containing protein [Aestuariibaculum suncheonense]